MPIEVNLPWAIHLSAMLFFVSSGQSGRISILPAAIVKKQHIGKYR